MIFRKNLSTRAVALICAGALVSSLAAAPAFAEPASESAAPSLAQSYEGTTYSVTVYGGNQGTVNGAESVELGPLAMGDTVDFSGITVEVPADSKYYAKGIRLAGLDNVRSDKNRDGKNTAGELTVMVAQVNAATGELAGSTTVTEDTDFVVAYGIMANRVSFTVTYTDTEGNELAEPQTFFGDIGDVPATAPVYIEGYVPDASLLTKTLVEDESQNVFPFVYTRLASDFQTEENPGGGVDVIGPDGSTAPDVYVTAPNITIPGLGGTTTTGGVSTAAATGTGAGAAAGADAAAGAGATPTAVPLVTDTGTEVVADDGTPLTVPQEESLDDDETALSSGLPEGAAPDAAPTAANGNWLPWAIAAGVVAVAIVLVLVLAARKRRKEQAAVR